MQQMSKLLRFRPMRKRRRATLTSKRTLRMPKFTLVRTFYAMAREKVKEWFDEAKRFVVEIGSVLTNAVIRAVMSPFESLVTVTVEDHVIRIVITRGYRVTFWSEVTIPPGVVKDGAIVDSAVLQEKLDDLLAPVLGGFHFGGRRLAIAVSGRNHAYREFNLFVPSGADLGKIALEALQSDLDVTSSEMLLDWEVEGTAALSDESRAQIAKEMTTDSGRVPDGRLYDIYGVGLRRRVVERNTEDLSFITNRIAGIQPKTLALAAATNELTAIIVDVEFSSFTIVLVRNGLPQVVRESSFDPQVRLGLLAVTIENELGNAIEFADAANGASHIDETTPLFLTGMGSKNEKFQNQLSSELPYEISDLPPTLRAPEGFSFDRFASNVGMTLVAGKRFWQLTAIPMVSQPTFELRPDKYRPRPMPIKAMSKVAVSAAAGVAVFYGFTMTADRTDEITNLEGQIANMESLIDQREDLIGDIRRSRIELERIEGFNSELQSETAQLRDRDKGYAETLTQLTSQLTEGVELAAIRDSGSLVMLELIGDDHRTALEYIDKIGETDWFKSVHVDHVTLSEPEEGEASAASVRINVQLTRLPAGAPDTQEIVSN